MCNKCKHLPVDSRAASRVLAHAIRASSEAMTGKAIRPRPTARRIGKLLLAHALFYTSVLGILAVGVASAQ